jgi:hypothetical protein
VRELGVFSEERFELRFIADGCGLEDVKDNAICSQAGE